MSYGICPKKSWATNEPIGYFGIFGQCSAPLRLRLPDGHRDMGITLHAEFSIGFTEDISNALVGMPKSAYTKGTPYSDAASALIGVISSEYPPGVVRNIYSVQFWDYDGNVVWNEWDSIPTGSSREYFVGANVKYIAVRSGYNLGPLDALKTQIPGRVSYSNAHET